MLQRKLASGGELAGPWLIEVAGLYIAPALERPAPALQFEAALGLLRLSALARRVARTGDISSPPWTHASMCLTHCGPQNDIPSPSTVHMLCIHALHMHIFRLYCRYSGRVAAPVAAAARWSPLAVATILELWERQGGTGGGSAVVAAAAEHLADLPAAEQTTVARQLVPLVAKLPFAAERADAFAKV